MKQKGIPFVWSKTEAPFHEPASGFRPALVLENHEGSEYNGVMVAGLSAGCDHSLEGIVIAGLVTHSNIRTTGLAISGFGNFNQYFSGFQVAGFTNTAYCNFSGIQIAGVVNRSNSDSRGVSIAGLMNTTEGDFAGVQVSSIVNAVEGGNLDGVQISGAVNYSEDNFRGAQFSGIYNHAGISDRFCLQVGLANNIRTYEGGLVIQVGLYNKAGSQICPFVNVRGLKRKKK